MKNKTRLIFSLLCVLTLCSCASSQHVDQCVTGNTCGFWSGIWHGSIMFFSFIGSLFNNDIAIYAVNNNGAFYNLGFMLGIGGLLRLIKVIIKALSND